MISINHYNKHNKICHNIHNNLYNKNTFLLTGIKSKQNSLRFGHLHIISSAHWHCSRWNHNLLLISDYTHKTFSMTLRSRWLRKHSWDAAGERWPGVFEGVNMWPSATERPNKIQRYGSIRYPGSCDTVAAHACLSTDSQCCDGGRWTTPENTTHIYIYMNTWVCKTFRCIFGLITHSHTLYNEPSTSLVNLSPKRSICRH